MDLQQMIGAAGASSQTLILKSDNWIVGADLEIPENITLKLADGAIITIATGKTLTLHGLLEAPAARIFSGTGNVAFDSIVEQRAYPQWWGAKGDGLTEDSAAFQAAVNSFSNKGGVIFVPDGTYIIDSVGVKSNITVIGNSSKAILKQKRYAHYCISTNPMNGKTKPIDLTPNNIKFINITFRGTVDTDGFSEFIMLLDIRGSSNIFVSKCNFIGFRGDGIYLGEARTLGQERHNSKVTISQCIFDGINKDNRNAISVIDCDGIIIEKCSFKNCSRSKMPGAIDFEPDNKFNIVRNIKIVQNSFKKIGGFGMIIITIEPRIGKLNTTVENITIAQNVLEDDQNITGIYIGQQQFANDESPSNNILINNNVVRNTDRPFWILGVRDVRILDNTFEESKNGALLAFYPKPITTISVKDVKFSGNIFRNLSKDDGLGIVIYNADNIEFKNNTFDNIGKSNGTLGYALYFRKSSQSVDNVSILDNIFKGNNTTIPVQQEDGNISYREHNRVRGNTFMGSEKVLLPAIN